MSGDVAVERRLPRSSTWKNCLRDLTKWKVITGSPMALSGIPDPPDGYLEPYEYTEVTSLPEFITTSSGRQLLGIQVAVISIAVLVLPIDLEAFEATIDLYSGGSESARIFLVLVGFYSIHWMTQILHENIHKAVEQYFGYDTKIHYDFPASYTLVEEQMMGRRHNLLSLALPFLLISPPAYLVSFYSMNTVASVIAGLIFLLNTTYAANDFRGIWFLLSKPEATKTWVTRDGDEPRVFIYEPSEE